MKRIVFQSNQLSVRGTEVALYDYACYSQSLLGNQSLIAYQVNHPANDHSVIDKFASKFELIPYESMIDLDRKIHLKKCDLLYSIKAGEPDQIISKVVPTMVHAVFPQKPEMVHGSSYAFVSNWLSRVFSNNVIPAVPHMVVLPSVENDLRTALNIPRDVTVFGCHGGANSFDIEFVKQAVSDSAVSRKDFYFVFMNIEKFISHPRVIFLPPSADLELKVRFINTCDAMLHARKLGESFGLACAEFSIRNKPIFTYSKSPQRHHIDVLGNKAFLYSGHKSLLKKLLEFDRLDCQSRSWDCYSEKFSPTNVMRLFDQHLIQVATRNGLVNSPDFHFSFMDKVAFRGEALKAQGIRLSGIWSN